MFLTYYVPLSKEKLIWRLVVDVDKMSESNSGEEISGTPPEIKQLTICTHYGEFSTEKVKSTVRSYL